MRATLTLVASVALAGCEAPVSSTVVNGTIGGFGFKAPGAISAKDSSSITDNTMVLITDVKDACSHTTSLRFLAPDSVVGPDGGTAPALILIGGDTAYFDPGGGAPRRTASAAKVHTTDTLSDGTLLGHFDVIFGSDRVTGDYLASPCTALYNGCDASGAGLALPLLLALALRRRR